MANTQEYNFEEEGEEKSPIITPDEVVKIKTTQQQYNTEDGTPSSPTRPRKKKNFTNLDKISNRGNTVKVKYESLGRFDTPEELFFNDYTVKDINDITLSRQEEILETMVSIVGGLQKDEPGLKVEKMLLEEFFETLIGIKQQFVGKDHTHRWLCSCQEDIEDENKALSEQTVDLSAINYVSIDEAEDNLRDEYRELFTQMTPADFTAYIQRRYGAESKKTIEDVLADIYIKEPIVLKDETYSYEINFPRVEDLIKGRKLAEARFADDIKKIRRAKWNQTAIPLGQFKLEQELKLQKIEHEKAKATVLYSRALSLVKANGKVPKDDFEKIEEFSKMPKTAAMNFSAFFEKIKFGIHDERDFVCNLCGKTERGFLQQRFSPVELLPLDPNTSRKLEKSQGPIIHFQF